MKPLESKASTHPSSVDPTGGRDMEQYRHSRRVSILGLGLLTLSWVIGGPVIGGLAYAASQLIYLPLVFPSLMGAGGGRLVAWAVTKGKTLNSVVIVLACVLFALSAYGSLHYGGYSAFRREFRQYMANSLEPNNGRVSVTVADQWVDWMVAGQTGSKGFLGYLKLQSQAGITFSHIFDFTSTGEEAFGLSLTGGAVWLYLLVETGVIAYTALSAARTATSAPFCEHCELWYPPGSHIGTVSDEMTDEFMDSLSAGSLESAAAMVVQHGVDPPSLELYLTVCPGCGTGVLTVSRNSVDRRGRQQLADVFRGRITAEERARFVDSIRGNT
jgi:hypothetical protein